MSGWAPFHLFGKARLAAVADRVHEVLPQLARGWWSGACPIQLAGVTPAADLRDQLSLSHVRYLLRHTVTGDRATQGAGRTTAQSGDLWLALLGIDHVWMKLTGAWLGCDVAAGSPLTRHLQREFSLELFRRLAALDSLEPSVLEPEDAPKLPPSALRAGAGTVAIELDIDGVPLTLVAPIELWPQLATPPVRASRKTLTPAATALTQSRITLDVCLPAVQWSVAEAAGIAVGDFLDLRQDLSGRAHITGADLQLTLPAMLGKEGRHKTVTLMDESAPT